MGRVIGNAPPARSCVRLDASLRGVFDAIWIEHLNLNDPAIAAQALDAAGLDAAEAMRWVNDAEVKAALRATTEEAVPRGVFGAPTMFVGDGMCFGQDRLKFVQGGVGVRTRADRPDVDKAVGGVIRTWVVISQARHSADIESSTEMRSRTSCNI